MIRPGKIIWIMLLFLSLEVGAQHQKQKLIDSMMGLLPKATKDTDKVNLLNSMSVTYSSFNLAEGIRCGTEALNLAEKTAWNKGMANAHKVLGTNYKLKRELSKGLEHFNKAKVLNEAAGRNASLSVDLRNIGMIYFDMEDRDKALEYLLLSLSAVGNDKGSAAATYNNLGILAERNSDYPASYNYYEKALQLNEAIGNKTEIAKNYFNLSASKKRQGQFPEALALSLKALRIHEELNNKKGIGDNLEAIGTIYMDLHEPITAREYFLKGLQTAKDNDDLYSQAISFNKLGTSYHSEGNFDMMLEYQFKALSIHEKNQYRSGIANTLGHIAIAYSSQKKYSEAIRFYELSIAMNESLGNNGPLAYGYCNRGQVYLDIAKDSTYRYPSDSLIPGSRAEVLRIALDNLNKGIDITRKIGGVYLLQGVLKNRSEAESMLGDYVKALESYKEHILYKDSIYSQKKTAEITQNFLRYEYDKREDSLRFLQQLTDHQLREQTLLAVQQNQQLLLVNNEKDLQQLAFLKTQADLQIEQSKRVGNEKALLIVKKENDLQATSMNLQMTQLALKDKELQTKKLQRNVFIVAVVAILIFSAFSFYRYRKHQELEHHHAILNERLRISRDLHDDMGATLSSISVYSIAAKQRLMDSQLTEAHSMLDTISEDARDMVGNMSDMVWMINPQNDVMEKLLDRMQLFASNVLSARNVFVKFKADESLRLLPLSMDARKNIFLIFKEAINNIAKYADASVVLIGLTQLGGALEMSINDDGKGFNLASEFSGNGLRNMQQRANELKGSIKFISSKGGGTTVVFTCYPHN